MLEDSKKGLKPFNLNLLQTIYIALVSLIFPQLLSVFIYVLLSSFGLVSKSAIESIGGYFIISALTESMSLWIIYLFLKKKGISIKNVFGAVKSYLSIIGYVLGAFLLYMVSVGVVFFLISKLIPSFDAEQNQENPFKNASGGLETVLSFIALVIITPIVEEIIFRGFLYRSLKSTTTKIIAVLITSLVFGLAHMQWNVAVDTFVLSLFLIWVYESTGSLVSSIILHSVKNCLAFWIIFSQMK